MNFVENNGKKVAAILCVASAFPVVATVVAAKEEPGWHGDRYVNEDKTVAKGWQEIEGKSYYFSEDGTVNSSKTEKATTASVSSNITGEVKETVATASQEAVKEETEQKAAEVVETPVTTTEATDTTETPAETPAPEQTETPAPEQTVTPAPEQTETPAPEQTVTPAPEQTETPAPEQNVTPAPEQTETPAPEQTVTPAPEQTTPAPEVQAPAETPATSTLGQRISAEAQKLVGVTDGLWCTQVVQQALANAGVSDAYQLWPDQYAGQYGYYTNDPQEGDLLYYNNGGRGVDHIAIYIGNGQAVHGNYEGKTVIASAYLSTAASPQFIRVVR
ncbi:NlpC/P60 family protein [Holdemanella porci]|uniref:C40 family peptidase n=1 Tax=Holdemanella porci TaxID=2652276 RepID=UPI001D13E5EB|nr:NlpC/P60 family protein [Holdemanella porci]MCC3359876.1 NlpC/P60 family protein [Holdemanella porci]